MHNKDNYLQSAELSAEQNANMLDGILGNNAPLSPPVPVTAARPLDRVIEPPRKRRSRDREER